MTTTWAAQVNALFASMLEQIAALTSMSGLLRVPADPTAFTNTTSPSLWGGSSTGSVVQVFGGIAKGFPADKGDIITVAAPGGAKTQIFQSWATTASAAQMWFRASYDGENAWSAWSAVAASRSLTSSGPTYRLDLGADNYYGKRLYFGPTYGDRNGLWVEASLGVSIILYHPASMNGNYRFASGSFEFWADDDNSGDYVPGSNASLLMTVTLDSSWGRDTDWGGYGPNTHSSSSGAIRNNWSGPLFGNRCIKVVTHNLLVSVNADGSAPERPRVTIPWAGLMLTSC